MYNELYGKLRPLLSRPIPTDLEALRAYLDELRIVRVELAETRSEALKTLLEARPSRLRPKDREWTDLDRKIEMEAFTAEKEQSRQFLDDLWLLTADTLKMAELLYQELSR